jgi:hypothetical protein
MSIPERGARPTSDELAWGLTELFDELSIDSINEMLAKNVPLETLEFIATYSDEFCQEQGIEGDTGRRIPNLLLLGYLLRVVEERVLGGDGEADA